MNAGHSRSLVRGLDASRNRRAAVRLIEERQLVRAEAERRGVTGQAVTPFVLSFLHERSEGRTLAANRELVVANAGLAAEVAVASAAA